MKQEFIKKWRTWWKFQKEETEFFFESKRVERVRQLHSATKNISMRRVDAIVSFVPVTEKLAAYQYLSTDFGCFPN